MPPHKINNARSKVKHDKRHGLKAADSSPRHSTTDLNTLMRALDIDVIALTEILVPKGFRAQMGTIDAPAIHYNLSGIGRISINGGPMRPLAPHMLIIVPPNTPFSIEVDGTQTKLQPISRDCWRREGNFLRVSVPEEKAEIVQICGFFNVSFGQSVGLFRDLDEAVFEQFDPSDKIDAKLREAMEELLSQELGTGAMTASLLKQVIIALVRRSIKTSQTWTDRFAILSDRQITRAFADMVARPGAAHTIQGLAHSAGLSRSAFMSRFSEIFGKSPMVVLRDLRMRQAALDLATTTTSVDVIAFNAGYESRSSFVRAFRKTYGRDPSDYREGSKHTAVGTDALE